MFRRRVERLPGLRGRCPSGRTADQLRRPAAVRPHVLDFAVEFPTRHQLTNLRTDPEPTAEHDRRVVDAVVPEWAAHNAQPYALQLTGPADSRRGDGRTTLTLAPLDFCPLVSGHGRASGLLATAVLV